MATTDTPKAASSAIKDPRFTPGSAPKPDAGSFFYRKEVRQAFYQIVLVVGLVALFYMIVTNAAENLRRQNIASGFGFLDRTAGFDISQLLWIDYTNTSSYGRALLVGLSNTVLIAAIGIPLATILGFMAGIARLSNNWLLAKIATLYVEVIRNMPLLLQLFLWYFGVLKSLPAPRQSINMADSAFLNVRGLFLPTTNVFDGVASFFVIAGALAIVWFGRFAIRSALSWPARIALALLAAVVLLLVWRYRQDLSTWNWSAGNGLVFAVLGLLIIPSVWIAHWAKQRQMATGKRFPAGWSILGMMTLLPIIAYALVGQPLQVDYPTLQGFNFTGGSVVQPELVALAIGLTVYTGAFIAEIVRAGILGVPKGQWEAARAVGLSGGQLLRLVVIPQAARIIIPPLTSNYLNLTKNSSLAVAIAYPDFVNVGGTVLNQTGQAVEVILLIMAVYLVLSLLTSSFMNWFNAKMALVER